MVFDGLTARHSHEGSIILEYSGQYTEDIGFEGYVFHGLLERSRRGGFTKTVASWPPGGRVTLSNPQSSSAGDPSRTYICQSF